MSGAQISRLSAAPGAMCGGLPGTHPASDSTYYPREPVGKHECTTARQEHKATTASRAPERDSESDGMAAELAALLGPPPWERHIIALQEYPYPDPSRRRSPTR